MKISGTIITLNAEKYILRAVESLKLISDEVIVLDSESTDSTRKIAESAGAKVYIQSFLGDGPQKKEASKYASNDWVFSVDADEYLDKDLIDYVNQRFGLEIQKDILTDKEREKAILIRDKYSNSSTEK